MSARPLYKRRTSLRPAASPVLRSPRGRGTIMMTAGSIAGFWRSGLRAGAIVVLASILTGLGACDGKGEVSGSAHSGLPDSGEKGQETGHLGHHEAGISKPLSETDRLMLERAATACQSTGADGYVAFLDAFISSPAVRRRYSAAEIDVIRDGGSNGNVSTLKVRASEYRDFPIIMEDHYRKPSRAADPDEHVEVVFNQSSSNRISVEWTRVRYSTPSGEDGDLGTPVTAEGRPYDPEGKADGQLIFAPTAGCWELVADIRFRP